MQKRHHITCRFLWCSFEAADVDKADSHFLRSKSQAAEFYARKLDLEIGIPSPRPRTRPASALPAVHSPQVLLRSNCPAPFCPQRILQIDFPKIIVWATPEVHSLIRIVCSLVAPSLLDTSPSCFFPLLRWGVVSKNHPTAQSEK